MDELLVGYILPATGALAFLNEPMVKGLELALADITAAGVEVTMLTGDSGTDPAVASNTADDLLAEGVSAILGAAASGISLSIIDKVTGAGVIQMSPSNTSPSFTTYDDGGYYFRTAPPDLLQAVALGDLMTDDGVSAAGILYRADDYGRNLAEALADRLEANGVAVAINVAYDPEGSSFAAEVQQLREAGVDGVTLIAFDEGANIIQTMIEADIGPSKMPLFVPDGLASTSLWESVDANDPAVLAGVKGTVPSAAPDGGEPSFPQRFADFAPGAETVFSAHAYDTLVILTLAAITAGSTEAADYVVHINDVTRVGTKCSRFAACAEMLADGTDIDYDGASGPLDFTDVGEPGAGIYDLFEYNAEGGYDVFTQSIIEGP